MYGSDIAMGKHVQPTSRLIGPVTKRFRKRHTMHVGKPTTMVGEAGTNNKKLYTDRQLSPDLAVFTT